MDENTHSDHIHPPANPETDYSTNPTSAAPANESSQWQAPSEGSADGERPRPVAGREMLVQLQQMIDTMATQAGPVMREVAAKAAELAAIAGEKAGPLAHRAAGATETLGQRVAARSKDLAVELRRPKSADDQSVGGQPADEFAGDTGMTSTQESADWPSDPPRNPDD